MDPHTLSATTHTHTQGGGWHSKCEGPCGHHGLTCSSQRLDLFVGPRLTCNVQYSTMMASHKSKQTRQLQLLRSCYNKSKQVPSDQTFLLRKLQYLSCMAGSWSCSTDVRHSAWWPQCQNRSRHTTVLHGSRWWPAVLCRSSSVQIVYPQWLVGAKQKTL